MAAYYYSDADVAAPSSMSGDRIGTNQLQPTLGATPDKSEASNVSRNSDKAQTFT